jgi:hypothetical protein
LEGEPHERERERERERQSNYELLRIVLMLLIITHHTVLHGGAAASTSGMNLIISLFFIPIGKIAFVCFVVLSSWFLVDKAFSTKRFLKIWLETLFYSVVFYVITWLMNPDVVSGRGEAMSVFFPIIGNSHGFAAAYLAWYALTPFLAMIGSRLNRSSALMLIGLLALFEIGSQLAGSLTGYYQHLFSELLLFVMLYFIALYLKRWPLKVQNAMTVPLLIIAGIWVSLFLMQMHTRFFPGASKIILYILSISGDESSLLNIIGGIALFFVFKNITIPSIPFINKLASTTFGILLIHDHNFFRTTIWSKAFHTQAWYGSPAFPLHLFLTVCIVFVTGAFIDFVRQQTLERAVFESKNLQAFCEKWDSLFNAEEKTKAAE